MATERTHTFSIKLYIPQTVSKKFVASIHSMSFLSPELPLHLYQFIMPPCWKYCCYVWAGAYTCQIVGPSTY